MVEDLRMFVSCIHVFLSYRLTIKDHWSVISYC